MTNVYAFPPVRIVSASPWVEVAPVNSSRSFFTGARIISAAQRKRRNAQLTVAALGGNSSGAGYMENLRILLAGGVHLVRLESLPVNWWADAAGLRSRRTSQPVAWQTDTDPDLSWSNGDPVAWFTGQILMGEAVTDAGGFPAVSITGGPPNILIARAGEVLALFSPIGSTSGSQARVMRDTRTDETGAATIRLMSALTGSGRVNIGTAETAIFEMVSMSEPMQPVSGQWTYDLSFREVFADEIGSVTEVDPWR